MAQRSKIDEFYDSLETLPKLISDIAMSVAEAQRRLDQNYMEQLAAFSEIILPLLQDGTGKAEQYLSLFKAIAPSRYQFTETIVEVRADLQMTTASESSLGAKVGINTPVFAVAVNASYTKRSAYDYQAAALIRTQLNAVSSDIDVLNTLLDANGTPGAQLPNVERYKALEDLFRALPHRGLTSPPR
ncbi:MAG: hypothetical protein M3362_23425 [Acidobacteriota bacterium]|nr:hypothetical protein [Acidobacteriota bacterium]